MRNFTSNYRPLGIGSCRRLTNALLLCMAIALFNFTSVQAQVNHDTEQTTNKIQNNTSTFYGDGVPTQGLTSTKPMKVSASWLAKDGNEPLPNPDLAANITCTDLRVVLLLDESGSILNRDGVEQVRESTLGLAQVFQGSPATLTIIEFGSQSNVIFSSTVDATYMANLEDYLYGEYNGQSYDPNSIGINQPCFALYTNWEDALETTIAYDPNLLMFLTDGEPSAYNVDPNNPEDVANNVDNCTFISGGGQPTFEIGLERAIVQANQLKSNGTHIFGIGVGNGVIVDNLKMVSGDENFADNGNIFTDDYSLGSFESLRDDLTAGLNSICGTEIAIAKTVDLDQVCSDETMTFTITVENTGGSHDFDAVEVMITDTFPSDFTVIGIVGAPIANAEINGQILTYNVGDLAAGQTATIQVEAKLDGASTGDYTNTAYANAVNANGLNAFASVEMTDLVTAEFDVVACESFVLVPANFVATPENTDEESFGSEGNYTRVITGLNEAGCPTEATVNITIDEPATGEEIVQACGSYEWNGTVYETSGVYMFIFTGENGQCDSTATLNLTINEVPSLQEVITSCDTPPLFTDFGEGIYFETGVYPIDIIGENGECDGTITYFINIGVTGDICNDGDPLTENDVINDDCECAGTPVTVEEDCLGVAGGTASNDDCGICREANDPEWNTTCLDCAGVVNGTSVEDALGVCGGDCTADADNDGICDDEDDCVGELDAIGVCNGDCTADVDNDGICDDVDDCVGELDAIGVCNGDCTADADNDGICDDVDDCVGELDALGVCNGDCTADADNDGICDDEDDCVGELDALGVCNGDCTADADNDGICDDEDDCVGELDAIGVCNGDCTADADNDGICDDVDDCVGELDALGVCNGDCTADVDGDGICDDEDECLDLAGTIGDSCNDNNPNTYNDLINEACECVGTPSNVNDDCANFSTYFMSNGTSLSGAGSNIYKVNFAGSTATLNFEYNVDYKGHIAIDGQGGIAYMIDEAGTGLESYDLNANSSNGTLAITGALSKIVAAVYNPNDGLVYIGDMNLNKVFTVDPNGSGTPVFYANAPVSGGDLAIQNGGVYLATKTGNRLYKVIQNGNVVFVGNIPAKVNGIAADNNTTHFIVSNNSSGQMSQISAATGAVENTFDVILNGEPFTLIDGDLASGCTDSNPGNEACFGDEILAFNQGVQTNGSAVPAGRSNANVALGEPDRSNAAGGFVSLGVNGSITIGFAGIVTNNPGNDIKIWETSFSGDACGGGDDERADIEVSQNGVTFVSVGTICRDGEVDIAGTGLAYVSAIRITNAASTGTLDGYDLDGVEALYGCGNNPVIENGECYAAEVIQYTQGTKLNGSLVNAFQTNPNQALGMPERATSGYSYTTLGYGGSLTLAFNGAVPNGPGDDIEVVETTYGNYPTCASYPESADVYVAANGVWHFAKTVCKYDGFVNIDDAGSFAYIDSVKIVNNNTLSTTPDGFDVDGVVALHNCEDGPEKPNVNAEVSSELTSYPNPTQGFSKVVFTTGETTRTLVEVYDMSGRNVGTLFNQEAQAGKEYTLDFNGNNLPNGVYIYRMTTNNETIIEKFMIAR